LGKLISTAKPDFVGKRMLERYGLKSVDRPQLVGLIPVDHKAEMKAGAHILTVGTSPSTPVDQGWVSWFCKQALLTEKDSNHNFTVNGDGKQVRDLLHVDDAVKCYLAAHQHIATVSGQVFNIGGGLANSMSVVELLRHLSERLNLEFNVRHLPWRADDQRYFVADITKASALLAWAPTVDKFTGIGEVLKTLRERCDLTEVC